MSERKPTDNQCRYCHQFANDIKDVDLRPDGETWSEAYSSRICGRCRKHLNETRQFRYREMKEQST